MRVLNEVRIPPSRFFRKASVSCIWSPSNCGDPPPLWSWLVSHRYVSELEMDSGYLFGFSCHGSLSIPQNHFYSQFKVNYYDRCASALLIRSSQAVCSLAKHPALSFYSRISKIRDVNGQDGCPSALSLYLRVSLTTIADAETKVQRLWWLFLS